MSHGNRRTDVGQADVPRRVLLLGPGNSSHTLEWQQVLAELAGSCLLASMHPCSEEDVADGRVVRLAGGATLPLGLPRLVAAVRRLLREERYDAILAYYLTSYGLLASLAAGGRYLAVGAGSDLFPRSLRGLRSWAAGRALRHAAGGVAWTRIMGNRMQELGLAQERLHVGPRGVDRELFRPAEQPADRINALRVVSTRRLRPLFRHDVLLRAVAELGRRERPVDAELIGEGSERSRLEELCRKLNIAANVRLPGIRSKSEIARTLQEADVFVSLSRSDGLSASLLEAMSCGVLPVVSDIVSNRSVITHGVNGIVVSGGDPLELADALERVGQDEILRQKARTHNLALAGERLDIRRNSAAILAAAARWMPRSSTSRT